VLTALSLALILGVVAISVDVEGETPPTASPVASPSACVASSASPDAVPAREQAVSTSGAVTIFLTDQGFSPSYVESTNGHPLTITLVNTGSRPHGFTIARFAIDETVAPGATKTIVIEHPDLGDFPFTSDAPCDDGMQGLLVFYI
jgi:hypothetical protein